MNIDEFKVALAAALAACPPVRRRVFKKKLVKKVVALDKIGAFIKKYAPEEYEKIQGAFNDVDNYRL